MNLTRKSLEDAVASINEVIKMIDDVEAIPHPEVVNRKTILLNGKKYQLTKDGVAAIPGMVVWWYGTEQIGSGKFSDPRPISFLVHRLHKHDVYDKDGSWMPLNDCYGSLFSCAKDGPKHYRK